MSKEYFARMGEGDEWQLVNHQQILLRNNNLEAFVLSIKDAEAAGSIAGTIYTISSATDPTFGLDPAESNAFLTLYQNPPQRTQPHRESEAHYAPHDYDAGGD